MPVKRTGGIGIKLKQLTPQIEAALRPVIETVADMVKVDAQTSITAGSVSGAAHVPSAPGEPPNNDTGVLANSITVEQIDALRCRVVATAPYAAIQELGGTAGGVTLPERPYMRPAADRNRQSGKRLMEAAVAKVVNGSTV